VSLALICIRPRRSPRGTGAAAAQRMTGAYLATDRTATVQMEFPALAVRECRYSALVSDGSVQGMISVSVSVAEYQ